MLEARLLTHVGEFEIILAPDRDAGIADQVDQPITGTSLAVGCRLSV